MLFFIMLVVFLTLLLSSLLKLFSLNASNIFITFISLCFSPGVYSFLAVKAFLLLACFLKSAKNLLKKIG
jgi:hypothetical protein